MKPIVDIGVYMHRWSELQVNCIRSIAEHTRSSYNLIVVCEPGSCHRNMNRVLERSTADFMILMDEDVEIYQANWLDILLADLEPKDVGVVGTFVGRSRDAMAAWSPDHPVEGTWPQERPWIPAHVMAFPMHRVRDFLRFDECIPWVMGMTDVDACLQIRHHNLRVFTDRRVVVYHPTRDDDETRNVEERPKVSEQQKWFPEQLAYMQKKWGSALVGLHHQQGFEI